MSETVILKPVKGPKDAVKPSVGDTKSTKTKPTPVWPDIYDRTQSLVLFTPVEDEVALQAYYTLWRITMTGKGDPTQVQACKALIEQRLGRPFAKSPVGASSLDGVSIDYIDPYDIPEDEGEAGEDD